MTTDIASFHARSLCLLIEVKGKTAAFVAVVGLYFIDC